MPKRDESKIQCFRLWTDGVTLKEIQSRVTALPMSVRAWVREWERGKQGSWNVSITWGYSRDSSDRNG